MISFALGVSSDKRESVRTEAASATRPVEPGGYCLVILGASGASVVNVPSRGQLVIGRSETADVQIDDAKASRKHLAIRAGERVEVVDLGSMNGASVRGLRLEAHVPLALGVGDTVILGSTQIILQRTLREAELAAQDERAQAARREHPAPATASDLGDLEYLVSRVAPSAINALIVGETGVGKEVMARTLHERSSRAKGPYVCVNCAALSETLLESELFGYERGAFTGAVQAKPGLLETAHGGTAFLDEIGEMPIALQAKLLRVLEQREVQRIGALKPQSIDVRFLFATNRDLEAEVGAGRFRSDLYFRVNGITISIPPLRERVAEIEPLARAFVARASAESGRARPPALSPQVTDLLRVYGWPGNVRELRNLMERAVVLCAGDVIGLEHLPLQKMRLSPPPPAKDEAAIDPDLAGEPDERKRIEKALEKAGGNQTHAAKLLGVSRRTLVSRLRDYALPRPRKKDA